MRRISFTINGKTIFRQVEPRTHLADFVREELLLTGTHIGCEHGICGACTVMIDGAPARSCLTYAALCDGADVRTVESFDDDALMAQLRDAFKRHHALQCGYCTPGMLTTAYDIVRRLPRADEARIREELSGNLCRCTGYMGIVAAIGEVAGDAPGEARAPAPLVVRDRPLGQLRGDLPHAVAAAAPVAVSMETPAGDGIRRRVAVPVPPDRIWKVLRDLPVAARCLPGASLESHDGDGRLAGRITVAIGPMRASFAGKGNVRFDDARHSGRVEGGGVDAATRSRADGSISFQVEDASDGGSVLAVAIEYDLKGPLAQMGRSAIVADIVNRLLEMFAANLIRAAHGEEIEAAKPVGGLGMFLAAIASRMRGLLRPSERRERDVG